MADKITKAEKDQAVALDTALKARKTYVNSGTFVQDEITKIDGFLASPNLGISMRQNLTNIKKVLVENPKVRKDQEITKADMAIAENNIVLAKQVDLSAV